MPQDGLHDRAVAWSRHVSELLVVTDYVIWEFVNSLSAPKRRQKAHVTVVGLHENPDITIRAAGARLFTEGFELHKRPTTSRGP